MQQAELFHRSEMSLLFAFLLLVAFSVALGGILTPIGAAPSGKSFKSLDWDVEERLLGIRAWRVGRHAHGADIGQRFDRRPGR